MGFDHNKALPGATCNCGHLSCYHITMADAPTPNTNKSEIDIVKQQIQTLEERLHLDDRGRISHIINRISALEESVEKNKEEADIELKSSYRNAAAAWALVAQLQQHMKKMEHVLESQSEQIFSSIPFLVWQI
jgi:hypothetical protein